MAVDGQVKEYAAQADYDVAHAGTGSALLTSLYSRVYTIVAYVNPADGLPALRVIVGVAALTPAQVAPTDAAIDAEFADAVPWYRIAEVTINRTGDTTVTQSQVNSVRPSGIPKTVHRP